MKFEDKMDLCFNNLLLQVLLYCCCFVIIGSDARNLSQYPPPATTDVTALLAFTRSSVVSDPKRFLVNWNVSSGTPCVWRGVSCSNDGNVTALNLTNAGLIGSVNLGYLAALPYLKHVFMSGNLFSAGDLSVLSDQPCVFETLDLSSNNFTDHLHSPQFLLACTRLSSLNLSSNFITGATLSFGSSLLQLDISHNNLSAIQFGDCGNLTLLNLSRNRLKGFPGMLSDCKLLETLDLSHNGLYGDTLGTFLSHLPSLKHLYIPFNIFSGTLPLSLANCTQLEVLDLGSNDFTGEIPSAFCSSSTTLARLKKLLLPNNFLSGAIPAQLGNCESLTSIDLSFNSLVGSIPLEIWNLPHLSDLVMWANNLTGEIPEGICVKGGNLEMLILNNNLLTGSIPHSIAKCTNLIWVSLSNNGLTGDIPDGVGDLPSLAIFQLGHNSLSGKIPSRLGKFNSLIWLDLNSNNLTGSIPWALASQSGFVNPGLISGKQFAFVRNEGGTSCRGAGGLVEFEGVTPDRLESNSMVHACASTRIYTGLTMYTFTSNGSMIYLDLSYNTLSGPIPENFGSMSYVQVLNLGHNRLSGKIPDSFGGLKAVGVLDLSHNNLQGFVPGSLGALSFLSDLDVSNNNLTGHIPSGGQLTTFPEARYENNSGLCGVPLPPCGSHAGSHDPGSFHAQGQKQSMVAGMIIGITASLLCIGCLTLALYRMKKHRQIEQKRIKYIESLPTSSSSSWKLSSVPEPLSINVATFETPLRKLTFAHLLEATNGFSSKALIGSGGFGEVYKAQLKDGSVVAIKKLIHVTGQGDREFMAEMETIGKIKHRNLVPLLGYCRVGDERLLVYEYMKWGSLEYVLHDRAKGGGGSKLDWSARKKIVIGSARGLAFLHHSCIPHIIHRDMKSSNVLLDENFEARVSDFGMARLVNALDTHLSVSTLAGTPGYVPPEYYQSFRCTTKGDVYSFGVILLELLAGKRPIDPLEFGDDNNLVGWAKQLRKENRINDILDPELVPQKSACEPELYQYLKIAFDCLDDRPFRRPTMIQVMAMFKELQTDSTEDDSSLQCFSVNDKVIEELRDKEVSSLSSSFNN